MKIIKNMPMNIGKNMNIKIKVLKILDNLEMKTIVKIVLKWKEEQELFGIDTTKYWVV